MPCFSSALIGSYAVLAESSRVRYCNLVPGDGVAHLDAARGFIRLGGPDGGADSGQELI